jgi:hypothetical protein
LWQEKLYKFAVSREHCLLIHPHHQHFHFGGKHFLLSATSQRDQPPLSGRACQSGPAGGISCRFNLTGWSSSPIIASYHHEGAQRVLFKMCKTSDAKDLMYSLRRATRTLMSVIFVLYAASTVTAQHASTPAEPINPSESKSPVTSAALNNPSSVAMNTIVEMPPPLSSDADKVRDRQVMPRPISTVEVNAASDTMKKGLEAPYRVTQDEVLSSAGTWGDFSRFLQLLPGVVWNSDMSNDVLVRGGNPTENLYVVNGIEVPNINHLAMEGTTGGFTSMIDTSIYEPALFVDRDPYA